MPSIESSFKFESKKPGGEIDLLANLSQAINNTLRKDASEALANIRTKLFESASDSDLSINKIPKEIKEKLNKYIEVISTSQDIWKIDYTIQLSYNIIESLYGKNYFSTKEASDGREIRFGFVKNAFRLGPFEFLDIVLVLQDCAKCVRNHSGRKVDHIKGQQAFCPVNGFSNTGFFKQILTAEFLHKGDDLT